MSAENVNKVALHLFDFFRKNKGIETIASDFNEAIGNEILLFWKKVKPIFIKEDKELIEKIEENPNDETLQGGLKYQISKKLSDDVFKKDLENFLKSLEKVQGETGGDIGISANTVTMKGKFVAGIQKFKK
ncbi:MAG: hypothetical protein IPN20_23235 [Haliscomenobacter sp.]|nr:hypothetical protein [Haliscomenobacter sp.]